MGLITFPGRGTHGLNIIVPFTPALLLDLYPNAAFAYGMRKLRTAYAGSAVRLREDNGDTEQDFGFVGEDLDTTSIESFRTSSGATDLFIVTWYDQAGTNNLNVTQSTAATQPLYSASGSPWGLPAAYFQNTASQHLASSDINMNVDLGFTDQMSFFLVMSQDGANATNGACGNQANLGDLWRVMASEAGDILTHDMVNTASRSTAAQPSGWDDTSHILELYRDASDEQGMVVDGSQLDTDTYTSSFGGSLTDPLYVGAWSNNGTLSNPFQGYQSELVVWATDLGSSNRSAARANINGYYSAF